MLFCNGKQKIILTIKFSESNYIKEKIISNIFPHFLKIKIGAKIRFSCQQSLLINELEIIKNDTYFLFYTHFYITNFSFRENDFR